MAWTKDTTTAPPKTIYTSGLTGSTDICKIIYDPNAPVGEKYAIYYEHIISATATIGDVEAAMGM